MTLILLTFIPCPELVYHQLEKVTVALSRISVKNITPRGQPQLQWGQSWIEFWFSFS